MMSESEMEEQTVSEQQAVPELLYSDSESSMCGTSEVGVTPDDVQCAGDTAASDDYELHSDADELHVQTTGSRYWNRQHLAARKFFRGRVDVSLIKIVRINNFVEDKLRPRDANLLTAGLKST